MSADFRSFDEFWPYYMAMHSRRATRWLHLSGTLTGAVLSATALVTQVWILLPALPVLGYGAAWLSHWLIERNKPATFGHPVWSLRGDMRMIATIFRGRDRSLEATARIWLDAPPTPPVAQKPHSEPVIPHVRSDMNLPEPSAPFSEKMAYYRAAHASRGVRATHLVGIPVIVASLPLLFSEPLIGAGMLIGGWIIQVAGHWVFEKNKPALTKGFVTYQLTGLAYWCEEVGDIIARRHRRRMSAPTR
jgi:hypothetical protein